MLKFLSSVVLSTALAVASVLTLIHVMPKPTPPQPEVKKEAPKQEISFSQIRKATWRLDLGSGHCSGTAIAPGVLLTAAHCDSAEMRVGLLPATKVSKDEASDLMLLSVPGLQCPCVPVAVNRPKIDTKVYTVGFPLSFGVQFLTEGRTQGLIPDYTNFMAVTSPIIFGNSGGGVFALSAPWPMGRWELVGVVSGVAVAPVQGFVPNVIPHMGVVASTNAVNRFLENVR